MGVLMTVDRRDFLKIAGQAGAILSIPSLSQGESAGPAISSGAADVVVIGAGIWGVSAAWHMRRMGARVTLVDLYGPGNSRATSGDETRGVRSSYRTNEIWVLWAKEAIKRWREWDDEFGQKGKQRIFFTTGDIILRTNEDAMIRESKATWDKHGFKSEILKPDEIRYRYPQIRTEGVGIALIEPDAGVARARRTTQVVAEAFEKNGGTVIIAKASPGTANGRRMENVTLEPGSPLKGDIFVFAVGPWMGKVFPALMGPRTRMPMGHVFYYATPPADNRFTFPNCPSWNVPGVTGWPALGVDNRGFRVRTGGRPSQDPDMSVRWVDGRYHDSGRNVLQQWFPDLLKQPLLETRSCHYESSSSGNFVIDKHPDYDNVWLAGLGNAEGFKMGPVVGDYIAKRVLGRPTDPKHDAAFRIPAETNSTAPGDAFRVRRSGRG